MIHAYKTLEIMKCQENSKNLWKLKSKVLYFSVNFLKYEMFLMINIFHKLVEDPHMHIQLNHFRSFSVTQYHVHHLCFSYRDILFYMQL